MARNSLLVIATSLALIAVPLAQARGAATITVMAGKPSEFKFQLSTKSVAHGTVTFKVTNGGAVSHTFKVCTKPTTHAVESCAGKGTARISPGKSATLQVTFTKAGTYGYLCSVLGHSTLGMKGLLKVT
jgi:uncharacterized cupredoxin-like copper-binding protein